VLVLGNSVLNYHKNRQDPKADCTASLTRTDLNAIILGQAKLPRLVTDGKVKIAGDPQKLQEMLSLLDSFEPWFDVVTTNPPPRN
jgi:alkyl sulfatase BDS1-like metallo-beta-lactamase superfamily hydrolase